MSYLGKYPSRDRLHDRAKRLALNSSRGTGLFGKSAGPSALASGQDVQRKAAALSGNLRDDGVLLPKAC